MSPDETTYVERQEVRLLYVPTILAGIPAAFERLEQQIKSMRGRRFLGAYYPREDRYLAGMERQPGDVPSTLGLEEATIPGGLFARRILIDWSQDTAQIGRTFLELEAREDADPDRPSLEYYRRHDELHVLLPVRRRRAPGPG